MLLNFNVGEQLVKVRIPEVRRFADGETAHLALDPNQIHLFDPKTRLRIGR